MAYRQPVLLFLISVAALFPCAGFGAGKTLVIGAKFSPSSMDPHFHASGANDTILPHIYDSLVRLDKNFHARPGLATAWRKISDTVWEFDLRRGVRFHDGSLLTTKDIEYSFRRIPHVKNSPGSFEAYTGRIAKMELLGPHKFRLHTKKTTPLPVA